MLLLDRVARACQGQTGDLAEVQYRRNHRQRSTRWQIRSEERVGATRSTDRWIAMASAGGLDSGFAESTTACGDPGDAVRKNGSGMCRESLRRHRGSHVRLRQHLAEATESGLGVILACE